MSRTAWIGLLGLILLLLGTAPAEAQRITGRVLDGMTGSPLPGANVVIQGTNIGTATDPEGRYTLSNVAVGPVTLIASYIGYEPVTETIEVIAGQTVQQNFRLGMEDILGEGIEVTAQAAGQRAAINQQRASNTITNIVSADRIQELPDVNAAESIGRLPGVSIQRQGGEATRVAIRGLSPKYNTVTVNGVRVPATGGDDRAVDLGIVSSNMLGGIEVRKAITPDMDADAIGGAIDLRLRNAPEGFRGDFQAQTGYNALQETLGNYRFAGTLSNRFFDNRLGIIGTFSTDDHDRSADKFSGAYRTETLDGEQAILIESVSLREENVRRGRTGASLVADYMIPEGRITANTFYNRMGFNGLHRINRMDLGANRHYYDLEDRHGNTSVITAALGVEQELNRFRYDFTVSTTASRTNMPDNFTWHFVQESRAFDRVERVTPDTHPTRLQEWATHLDDLTSVEAAYGLNTHRAENESSAQGNFQVPFRFGEQVTGYVRTGGRLRWMDRTNNEETWGRSGMQYGGGDTPNQTISCIARHIPEWDVLGQYDQYGMLPIRTFLTGHERENFLGGEYSIGFTPDEAMMRRMTEVMQTHCSDEWLRMAIASRGRDYTGEERYQAGYLMSEINIGRRVTVIPGFRYEGDFSRYTGQSFREVVVDNIQQEPLDLQELEVERTNAFFLPMVHLQVRPTDWLQVRLARTETLTRPDFMQYAPITTMNTYQNYIRAANAAIRPAHSTNYDVSVSVFRNRIGMFSVAGFHKSIDDLIFAVNLPVRPGMEEGFGGQLLGELNIPDSWIRTPAGGLRTVRFGVDTFINNPYETTYTGFELDWQTSFWYLPSPLNGLVLNLNYTQIHSEVERQQFRIEQERLPGFPPRIVETVVEGTRLARMPDQPAHIANATVGYDFRGFSGRLSYLFQTDRTVSIGAFAYNDTFTEAYSRWDLSLRQSVGYGAQVYANFSNLSGAPDRTFRGTEMVQPTFIEYYGFTMDLGVRYRF